MPDHTKKFKPASADHNFSSRRAQLDVRWRYVVHGHSRPYIPGELDYRPKRKQHGLTRDEIIELIREVSVAELPDFLDAHGVRRDR